MRSVLRNNAFSSDFQEKEMMGFIIYFNGKSPSIIVFKCFKCSDLNSNNK